MAITLYEATVPHFLQVLGGLRGVLDKGLEHTKARGLNPDELAEARLIDDMFSLQLQIQRAVDHSSGALRDVAKGAFSMPSMEPVDYAGLQRLVADADAAVRDWSRDRVNALEGRKVLFDTGSSKMSFTAEDFLFSFSVPNFYFHSVTAYDILRMKGVPIGKRDYLGAMRARAS